MYLTNRQQRVVISGAVSNWLPVTSGVPEGSILGSFLFLLYTNDLDCNFSTGTSIALYADDAKVFWSICSTFDCYSFTKRPSYFGCLEHYLET